MITTVRLLGRMNGQHFGILETDTHLASDFRGSGLLNGTDSLPLNSPGMSGMSYNSFPRLSANEIARTPNDHSCSLSNFALELETHLILIIFIFHRVHLILETFLVESEASAEVLGSYDHDKCNLHVQL